MSHDMVRIKRLTNGYSLYYRDPEIVAANRKPSKSGSTMSYRDPEREMAFKSVKELTAFLDKHLDSLCPMDEYESSFDTAMMELEDD